MLAINAEYIICSMAKKRPDDSQELVMMGFRVEKGVREAAQAKAKRAGVALSVVLRLMMKEYAESTQERIIFM